VARRNGVKSCSSLLFFGYWLTIQPFAWRGKNIFEACKAAGVKHFVFSALPCAEKVSGGKLLHVDHFDGKSIVADYVEANKGEMLSSYFMPGKETS
jgi:hypothetical protein